MRIQYVSFAALSLAPAAALAQQSTAILDAPVCVGDPRNHYETLLDVDADGFMDVVTMSRSTGSVGCNLYRNDGTGRFVGAGGLSASGSYYSTAWAERFDMNGDVYDDFYLAVPSSSGSGDGGDIYCLQATGTGGVIYDSHWTYHGGFQTCTLADFDQNGVIDRARTYGTTLFLDRLVVNGSGYFDAFTTTATLVFQAQKLVLVDCNGDATPDLYAHGLGQGAFIPIVDAVPQAPIPIPHGISTSHPMAAPGDIDGDGDVDLVFFDMMGFRIHRRTGPGTWELEPHRAGGMAAKLADVDNDGDLDGICCGGSGDYPYYFSKPSTFMITLNDGTGNFAPNFSFPGLGSREIAGAADLDHDGDVDLVAGTCIYWGRGPLVKAPMLAIPTGEHIERSLVDFDRDGDLDFGPGLGTFERHLGDGSSHAYAAMMPAPPAGNVFQGPGLPGDWDGDGDADLYVRVKSGNIVLSTRLLVNEGGGTYADGGDACSGDVFPGGVVTVDPKNAYAQDLDADGDLDLVTFVRTSVSSPNGRTKTWLNDGQGGLALAWEYTAGWPVGFGRIAGGDAFPDMIMLWSAEGDGRLLRGLGTGAFDTAPVLQMYFGDAVDRVSAAIADFDSDGDEDVVGAFQFGGPGWYSGHAYFIPNVGGTLSLADKVELDVLENESSSSGAMPTPRTAVAGDVDGDGRLDVIISSPFARRAAVSIVRRKTDNSGWELPVRQVVYWADPASGDEWVQARPGACVDIDSDGDGDFVTESVWRNVLRSPPDNGGRRQNTIGTPDMNGVVPTLGATGLFRVGESATIRLTGAPGNASGVLVVSYYEEPTPFTGGGLHRATHEQIVAQIAFTTSGAQALRGSGEWLLPYTVPSYVAGRTKRYSARLQDPNAPGAEVRSNDLFITYGP